MGEPLREGFAFTRSVQSFPATNALKKGAPLHSALLVFIIFHLSYSNISHYILLACCILLFSGRGAATVWDLPSLAWPYDVPPAVGSEALLDAKQWQERKWRGHPGHLHCPHGFLSSSHCLPAERQPACPLYVPVTFCSSTNCDLLSHNMRQIKSESSSTSVFLKGQHWSHCHGSGVLKSSLNWLVLYFLVGLCLFEARGNHCGLTLLCTASITLYCLFLFVPLSLFPTFLSFSPIPPSSICVSVSVFNWVVESPSLCGGCFHNQSGRWKRPITIHR